MLMSAQCTNLVSQPHSHPASQVMPEVPTRVGANINFHNRKCLRPYLNWELVVVVRCSSIQLTKNLWHVYNAGLYWGPLLYYDISALFYSLMLARLDARSIMRQITALTALIVLLWYDDSVTLIWWGQVIISRLTHSVEGNILYSTHNFSSHPLATHCSLVGG